MLDLNKELDKWAKDPKLESLLEILIDYLNEHNRKNAAVEELRQKFKLLKDMAKDLDVLAELAAAEAGTARNSRAGRVG